MYGLYCTTLFPFHLFAECVSLTKYVNTVTLLSFAFTGYSEEVEEETPADCADGYWQLVAVMGSKRFYR